MARTETSEGRPNQRRRTRKDLLTAAARLLRQGRTPTLEEVAAEAMVSRATAYRYFASIEALMVEAALDVAVPTPEEAMRGAPADDPVQRVLRADAALNAMLVANEAPLRLMLANSLQRGVAGDRSVPARQNRRTPLIEAALAPARSRVRAGTLKTLSRALALVIGTEAMIVTRDVLQLDDAEARRMRRWAIRALVEAALAEG